MRINFQCSKCDTPYTLQLPDGIGHVGVTVACPCGNAVVTEFDAPPQPGQVMWVVASEHVRGSDQLG